MPKNHKREKDVNQMKLQNIQLWESDTHIYKTISIPLC